MTGSIAGDAGEGEERSQLTAMLVVVLSRRLLTVSSRRVLLLMVKWRFPSSRALSMFLGRVAGGGGGGGRR